MRLGVHVMPPTFGDTRPTFGYPPAVRDVREPERPTIGAQLGMDGTELPAIVGSECILCDTLWPLGVQPSGVGPCCEPICADDPWSRDDDERCPCDESGREMPYQAGAWRE